MCDRNFYDQGKYERHCRSTHSFFRPIILTASDPFGAPLLRSCRLRVRPADGSGLLSDGGTDHTALLVRNRVYLLDASVAPAVPVPSAMVPANEGGNAPERAPERAPDFCFSRFETKRLGDCKV